MLKKAIFSCLVFSLTGVLHAQTLCTRSEKIIFSFHEKKSKKLLSLCKGERSDYLIYRFGTNERIELQYPEYPDAASWKKFEFYGLRRDGGRANAGFGDYSISFVSRKTEYVIFQEWSDDDDAYLIGVNVQSDGRSRILTGDRKTQQGSLLLLESESKKLPNSANP